MVMSSDSENNPINNSRPNLSFGRDAVKTILLPQKLFLPVLGEAHGGNVYIGILK